MQNDAKEAQQQRLVLPKAAKKKYIPFKPDFFSSEPVQLAGSWNDWSLNVTVPIDSGRGEAGLVVELDESQHGNLTYKYNVGGKWHLARSDTAAADMQGCVNSSTAGRTVVPLTFPSAFAGPRAHEQSVHVIGSFTGWQVAIPMTLGADGNHHCDVALPPGQHTLKFVMNAVEQEPGLFQPRAGMVAQAAPPKYAIVDTLERMTLASGDIVNVIHVDPPATFKLLYHTQFSEAYVTYRFSGQPGPPQRLRMHHQPGCSGLMLAHLPAPGPDCSLEFSITGATYDSAASLTTLGTLGTLEDDGWPNSSGSSNGKGNNGAAAERDPQGGGVYTASRPGVWRLQGGSLRLDDASQLPPLMLCTDLDGTLIEDGEDGDWVRQNDQLTYQASQHFAQYLAPAGGLIVFNTGRSIGEGALARGGALCRHGGGPAGAQGGVMPWPTAIITAVGTKVFLWDVAARKWAPDPAYARLLDDGWNLAEVQNLSQQLMRRFNGNASCVDDGSEHPHRVSLSIRSDVLDEFLRHWGEGLDRAGVQHQFVSSIGGEWRYVDCIAKNAGKGRAMAYLAEKFGVALEDAVAAGDSGNDLLMLGRLPEGCHPAIVMSNSHPEVWDWLARITPEERAWIYTPKAERAAGIVEGLKAIVAVKLKAHAERRQRQQAQQRSLSPAMPAMRALRG
ncbi:sucrose-6F-phosphate phosphohydrolase-domain-containing protein [Scenedesmus sp. NREL 46B-D3]|nr:sucrose-6F-phosphate phosphohydrolase-domain-containing protein [Scenedesmus sp. NREL 46B-D3]